jgi:Flp pilus assembly CpaF family ATPase
VDESSPLVDGRLPDGSRVNIVVPPIALDGPVITIRKFSRSIFSADALIENQSISRQMAEFFALIVVHRLNVMITGRTSSGKTTLLNLISNFIPSGERIVTIEEMAEVQLRQRHVVRLETRAPNVQGKGEITVRTLFRNALHMRPDRIIVGELPGRGDTRHAPGHEHRPRRLHQHGSLQFAPGSLCTTRGDDRNEPPAVEFQDGAETDYLGNRYRALLHALS